MLQSPVKLPADAGIQKEQLQFYSDFKLAKQHRLLEELQALRNDLQDLLKLELSDELIHVYLFHSRDEYVRYAKEHFPDLASRRAVFAETDTRLAVFAYWGGRVAEDLRHEVAHGYVHSVVPQIPLWLDEGIAEYSEVPRGYRGVNEPHVQQLLQALIDGAWQPDLKRLEKIRKPHELNQQDYAECWAWSHWLLNSTTERRALVQRYLQQLCDNGAAPALSSQVLAIEPDAAQKMIQHLKALPKSI